MKNGAVHQCSLERGNRGVPSFLPPRANIPRQGATIATLAVILLWPRTPEETRRYTYIAEQLGQGFGMYGGGRRAKEARSRAKHTARTSTGSWTSVA